MWTVYLEPLHILWFQSDINFRSFLCENIAFIGNITAHVYMWCYIEHRGYSFFVAHALQCIYGLVSRRVGVLYLKKEFMANTGEVLLPPHTHISLNVIRWTINEQQTRICGQLYENATTTTQKVKKLLCECTKHGRSQVYRSVIYYWPYNNMWMRACSVVRSHIGRPNKSKGFDFV